MKKLAIFSFLVSGLALHAQAGSNVYTFMNIPFSARQAALGGDAVSIRDHDANFAAINPALMNVEMDNHLAINGAMYLAESNYGTIAYVKDMEYGNFIGAHARFMDYGKMVRTDEAGYENGEFGAMDYAIGLSYAKQFEEEWTIGGSVNYIGSKIDNYTSGAVSGSVGVAYHFKKTKETVAAVARNFGYQFNTFNGYRETLPFRVDLGYTRILKEFPVAITVTAHDLQQFDISAEYNNNGQEVSTLRKIADHFSFGAEIFPEKNFNIRLGYNIRRGNELSVLDQRSFSGLSGGFGVKFSSLRIDYAHVRYHNASNVNQIGIAFNLSGERY